MRAKRLGTLALTAALCLPVVMVSQYVAQSRTDDADAYFYRYASSQVARGRTLYTELWDFKPPGIFWTGAAALALAGDCERGVAWLCGLAAAAALASFYVLVSLPAGARLDPAGPSSGEPRRGPASYVAVIMATVIAAIYLYLPVYFAGGFRPETFIIACELAAVAFYGLAATRGSRACAFLCGACLAAALCFKQTAWAAAAAVVVDGLVRRRNTPAAREAAAVGWWWFATGGAVVLGAAASALAATSGLGEAWRAVVVLPATYAWTERGGTDWPGWPEIRQHVGNLALPAILAVAVVAQGLGRRVSAGAHKRRLAAGRIDAAGPPAEPAAAFTTRVATWWLLFALPAVLMTPHRQWHYVAPLLPPLLLLAGGGLALLTAESRAGRTRPYAVWLAIAWMAYMTIAPLEQHVFRALDIQSQRASGGDDADIRLARAVRQRCGPDETLYVSGYRPRLWYLCDRPPAGRHCGTMSAARLGRSGAFVIDEIAAALRADPPCAILVGGRELDRLDEPAGSMVEASHRWGPANEGDGSGDEPPVWIQTLYEPSEHRRLWFRRVAP